jgi:hypothetical protein
MNADKKKTIYSGTAMNIKKKDPELMGYTYGLSQNIAGVSDKVLLSMKEASKIENTPSKFLIKKKIHNDLN